MDKKYQTYQTQILVGTVLGGSSLVKPPKGINYYLSMRSQNENWLQYKMLEMPDFFPQQKVHHYGNTLRCNSACLEQLTEFREKLYSDNKRKISMEILDPLMDIGIAVWFLDGGGKTGRGKKNAYINTTKFGEDGTETVIQYFHDIDMPCNLNRDGDRLKVLFTVKSTETLLATISHRFPSFMYHRV